MKQKIKKPSAYQVLRAENARLRGLSDMFAANVESERQKRQTAERAQQYRVDQTMLKERIDLTRALGQLVEATSKAVQFIVAKESL